MRAIVIGFGLLILCLLLFFRVAELQVWQGNMRMEVIVAAAAILFFFIGIYVNRKSVVPGKEQPDLPVNTEAKLFIDTPHVQASTPNAEAVRGSGLTARELEVLQKMADGLSNAEIGAALFLSESTIKTHVSNILFKLDVKRRTAAIQAARERGILA